MLSNLPPGCSNADIEAQCDESEGWVGQEAENAVNSIGQTWCGYDTHLLIADILEATGEDFEDVLTKAIGEMRLRKMKKERINQIMANDDAKHDFM